MMSALTQLFKKKKLLLHFEAISVDKTIFIKFETRREEKNQNKSNNDNKWGGGGVVLTTGKQMRSKSMSITVNRM